VVYSSVYIAQMRISGYNIYDPSELETKFRAYLVDPETSKDRVWLGYTNSAVCSLPVILCLVVKKETKSPYRTCRYPVDPAVGTLRIS
jgi:hypothetical protein